QNNTSVVIQLFFVLLLVLANGIQAFRARKLPSHFKETNHVIYSSFTTVLLIAASTGIYFAQKSFNVKDRVLWISIHLLNALNFLLIYIYKMFVMLFKPQRNTTEAFNEKRTKRINNQFLN
uniref:G-protein coupled receptors family 3 profile domain-containing protein n=1 Tax=Clytia hemisphaerica TaxID=252671 RepID=A0A7M5WLA8_9CNID